MPDPTADFYVGPDGDDDWTGTHPAPTDDGTDGPFATLDRARRAVREHLETTDHDVTVLLHGGTYRPEETVVFGRDDGGAPDQTVTYAAYPDEEPVLAGSRPIDGWEPVSADEEPETVTPAASGNLWAADVSHVRAAIEAADATDGRGDWAFAALYAGDERLPRARGPGFEPTVDVGFGERHQLEDMDHDRLEFPDGALRDWPRVEDAELRILPSWDWTVNLLPIASVDEDANVATTAVPGTYPLIAQVKDGFDVDGSSAWVENALPVLDEPGEWVLDTDAETVYLWPEGDVPPDDVTAPVLSEFVRVEGDVDYEGPTDRPVRNLAFRGLTFTEGARDTWDPDHLGWGLQHSWDMFDRGNAMVRFRGVEACTLADCRLVDSAAAGVRLDLHCQRVRVADSTIAHVGGTGVLLSGYGPGLKDVHAENEVVNNHVHHCGRDYWHAPGIFVTQSGANRIAHNELHDQDYTGLIVSGIRQLYPDRLDHDSQRTVRWFEIAAEPAPVALDHRSEEEEMIEHPRNLPYRHARNNVIEYNEIHDVMQRLGDGNGIYLSGAGTANLVHRNYVHDVVADHCNAAIRTDGWQRGTEIRENVITRSTGPGLLLKDRNDAVGNVLVDLKNTGGDEEGLYVSLRAGPTVGSRIEQNVYVHSGPEVDFYRAQEVGWLPEVDISEADADNNVFWWTDAPEGWGEDKLAELREDDIEHGSIFADPEFVDPDADDYRLAPGSPAFDLGIVPVDRREMGLLDDR